MFSAEFLLIADIVLSGLGIPVFLFLLSYSFSLCLFFPVLIFFLCNFVTQVQSVIMFSVGFFFKFVLAMFFVFWE